MQMLISVLLFSIMTLITGGDKSKPTVNKNVQFSVKIVEKSIKPGSSGTLQLLLTPAKGIHVNLDPPMSFSLDSTRAISKVAPLDAQKDQKKGYLDTSKPIQIKFTLAKNVKPGPLTLKGTFIYFYCSDAEGWCNRFKQPIEMNIIVTK